MSSEVKFLIVPPVRWPVECVGFDWILGPLKIYWKVKSLVVQLSSSLYFLLSNPPTRELLIKKNIQRSFMLEIWANYTFSSLSIRFVSTPPFIYKIE